jgi:hypothetical protein
MFGFRYGWLYLLKARDIIFNVRGISYLMLSKTYYIRGEVLYATGSPYKCV